MSLNIKKYNRKPLILIVDDVVRNIQLIGNLLVEQGYEISVAMNGTQALDTAKLIIPDLILLDVMMPNIDGYDICSQLKHIAELKHIPIIFLTAKSDVHDLVKGFSVGGADYITKPFQKAEVIARIENQLELKFARDYVNQSIEEISHYNSKLEEELSIAAEYFGSLLPEESENDFVKVRWKYVPTAKLGGDAFGYFTVDDCFIFYLFDVCGHGIASGLYSVSVLNNLKFRSLPDTDFTNPVQVLNSLNKVYQINEHYGFYFTIWYGVYNIKTRVLKYANAGHHPSIIFENKGDAGFLSAPNFIVGGLKNYKFHNEEKYIVPETQLYLFSDGVFDFKQPNGDIWTINELFNFIDARRKRNAKELTDLFEFVKSQNNDEPLKDDFTIMKITFK